MRFPNARRWQSFLLVTLPMALTGLPMQVSAQEVTSVLDGRIIRALAVNRNNPYHVLVGNKAKKPGSALVFQSLDGGRSWKILNAGKPLSPKAADVQSLVALDEKTILAGTWKYGLYISRDSGNTFDKIKNFPTNDIRDLQVSIDGRTVYAAAPQHGVFASDDKGRSWRGIGPKRHFFWSLTTLPGPRLYAVSLTGTSFCKCGSSDWAEIFSTAKAYGLAANKGTRLAIAAETGAYISKDSGSQWTALPALKGEKLADVLFLKSGAAMFASWADGLAIVRDDDAGLRRLLPGVPVVHLAVAGDNLLAGTWGKGLKIIPLADVQQ